MKKSTEARIKCLEYIRDEISDLISIIIAENLDKRVSFKLLKIVKAYIEDIEQEVELQDDS